MKHIDRFEEDMKTLVTPKLLNYLKNHKPDTYLACYNQWAMATHISVQTGYTPAEILMKGTVFMAFATIPKEKEVSNVFNLEEWRGGVMQ